MKSIQRLLQLQRLQRLQRLAHVSDLHVGLPGMAERAAALAATLRDADVDHVLITGDLTHRGRLAELQRFREAFAPLLERGQVTIVPGNHDRLGDDAGARLMGNERVRVETHAGLYLVRVDSTARHNRHLLRGHGMLEPGDLDAIDGALDRAPPGALVVVMLHHHPLPFPEELRSELFASLIGWRAPEELQLGWQLLQRVRGRCDLVLHGHRHVPRALRLWPQEPRPLGVYNAGSSTALCRARVFAYAAGELIGEPRWLAAAARPAAVSQTGLSGNPRSAGASPA